MREWLGVSVEQMAPSELLNTLLKAPVDLVYNGGIGTYVKASTQSHQEANDRSNDAIRVDATELRAKVIGEGGNLGMTQKGRIEFALAGGRLYTDAIDNSAGVDCSDHEVNIKILLSALVAGGDMTRKQRDALLASMTDDVGRLVLADNYQQTQAISLEAANGQALLPAHAQLIRTLEAKGALNRAIEFLPDDKALAERGQLRRGLVTSEIAVLLAYSKIALKEAILASPLPDAAELQQLLVEYFPPALVKACAAQLPSHPLKREIVTTQLVNRLVNRMGTSFVVQLSDETGADAAQVASAWFAASELIGAEAAWKAIEAQDLKLPAAQQMAMMGALRETVGAITQQILASPQTAGASISAIVERYRAAIAQAVATAHAGKNGDEALAALLEARASVIGSVELVDLAHASGRPIADVTTASAQLDASVDLPWLSRAIARLPASNRWQARARAQLANELRDLRRALLQRDAAALQAVLPGVRTVIDEVKRNAPQDLAMISASLAEIRLRCNA